jgi:hypothetical protein
MYWSLNAKKQNPAQKPGFQYTNTPEIIFFIIPQPIKNTFWPKVRSMHFAIHAARITGA